MQTQETLGILNLLATWIVHGKHISEIMQLGGGANSSNSFSTGWCRKLAALNKFKAVPSEGSMSRFSHPCLIIQSLYTGIEAELIWSYTQTQNNEQRLIWNELHYVVLWLLWQWNCAAIIVLQCPSWGSCGLGPWIWKHDEMELGWLGSHWFDGGYGVTCLLVWHLYAKKNWLHRHKSYLIFYWWSFKVERGHQHSFLYIVTLT